MQSDFFTPYNSLMQECNIFVSHKTAKDWFWYYTNRTITDVLMTVEDQLQEIEWIEEHMHGQAYELLKALEGYERYEWCKRVQNQQRILGDELLHMWTNTAKLR